MLTNYERETIITFNEAEADCEVYTYNPKLIRKLTERCESRPSLYRMVAEDQFGGYTFRHIKKGHVVKHDAVYQKQTMGS